MKRTVYVQAPSRLHFGMFSFHQPGVRRFGGVGAMIERPGLRLKFSAASDFSATGPFAARIEQFARRAADAWAIELPRCDIETLTAPRAHVGLGSGTQIGMAVAAGLAAFVERPQQSVIKLARAIGRGERSAIGLYGFSQGGLLIEAGKLADDEISPLITRVELPNAWRFVLLTPPASEGLSGADERKAFAQLPPVSRETTAALCETALLGLAPAAIQANFDAFSEALFDYGRMAGMCFASQQGGHFVDARLLPTVERVRAMGIRGVGQTSWGPTIFALLPGQSEAESFVDELRRDPKLASLETVITAPCNRGATISDKPEQSTNTA